MTNEVLQIDVLGAKLSLGDRFIRLEDDLIISDVHFGKTMHFRKAGMPIPAEARAYDQQALYGLIQDQKPKRLIVLGDLFHSDLNSEVAELGIITSQFSEIDFLLVKGNHDVMPETEYRSIDFDTIDALELGPFLLTHEPVASYAGNSINLHGHIHPGIKLRGGGRQSVVIPCYHISSTHFCMPAFGALTGLMKIRPKKQDRVFGIVEGEVIQLL